MPMFQLPEPAAMGETLWGRKQKGQWGQVRGLLPSHTHPGPQGSSAHLREVPDGAREDELAVLPVHALPLTASTQVVVRADTALVAGPHHRPIATIADHIGVYHVARPILGTRGAMVPSALLLLCKEGRAVRWDATKSPPCH